MLIFGSGYSATTDNYAAPTLPEMREKLARALRDPNGQTFTPKDLSDYVAAALVEVSRVYPREIVETFDLVNDLYEYPVQPDDIFRVELLYDDIPQQELEDSNGEGIGIGWDYFGRNIYLSRNLTIDEDHHAIRVWGYTPRSAAQQETDVLDVDQEAEQAVRSFAMLEAYQALLNDRGRFTQWNTLPGNTDVSMTQIEALATNFEHRWSETRKHLKRLRRQ